MLNIQLTQKIKSFLQVEAKGHYKLFWLTGAQVVNRAIRFFVFAYLARKLGVEGYGIFSFAFRFVLPFIGIADFGLEITGIRLLSRFPQNGNYVVRRIIKLRLLSSIVAFCILASTALIIPQSRTLFIYIFAFSGLIFFNEVSFNWPYYANGEYQEVGISTLLAGAVLLVGSLILVRNSNDVFIAIVVMTLSSVLSVIYLVVKYFSVYKGRVLAERFASNVLEKTLEVPISTFTIAKESFPLASGTVLFRAYSNIMPVLLGLLLTTEASGYFDVANQIPQFLLVLAQMVLNTTVLPIASRAYLDKSESPNTYSLTVNWKKLQGFFQLLIYLSALLVIVTIPILMLVTKDILRIVYGEDFAVVETIVIVLFIRTFIGLINLSYRSLLPAFDRQKVFFRIILFQSIFVILAGWILIDYGGLLGGAIAMLIGELFALSLTLIYLRYQKLLPYPSL